MTWNKQDKGVFLDFFAPFFTLTLVDIRTKYQFRGTQFFYFTLHKMTTKAPDCIFSRQLLARPLVGNTKSISYHLRTLNMLRVFYSVRDITRIFKSRVSNSYFKPKSRTWIFGIISIIIFSNQRVPKGMFSN